MTSSPAPRTASEPNFAGIAERYDELRPADEHWWERLDLLVREGGLEGRRVLDVGCGTGTLAGALADRHACRVWGVDPTPEMLAVARAKVQLGVGLKLGRAEELPFRDAWFERVTMVLVAHLVDRASAYAEARRVLVPGGRLALVTFDRDHFDRYYLNALFPSLRAIDVARFPSAAALEAEPLAAGFASVRLVRLSQRGELAREEALRRIRGRHISTLRMLDEGEYRVGLDRAERDLPDRIEFALEQIIAVAEAP